MKDSGTNGNSPASAFRWGIYEKALPQQLSWAERLSAAAGAGDQFVEISIDESEDRLARLSWPCDARQDLHRALASAPASIDTMCLSAHRKGMQFVQAAGTSWGCT